MRTHFQCSLIVLFTTLLSLPLVAQETNKDEVFFKMAGNTNQFEIALGTQALKQSENSRIKEYGQKLVEDHTKALAELEELANAKTVTLPTAMDEDQASIIKSLSVLSGADFDSAFRDVAIKTHENSIVLFENAAEKLNDPELKSWARGKIPALKNHLEHAQALRIESPAKGTSSASNTDSVETL